MAWIAQVAVAAYGAYQSQKANKQASQANSAPKYQVRTPYMSQYINPIIPYLLSEEQKIYENRMKTYGMDPGNFSPIAGMLAGISPNYNGLDLPNGMGGSGTGQSTPYQPINTGNPMDYASNTNPFSNSYGTAFQKPTAEQLAARQQRLSQSQGDGTTGSGGGELRNYWGIAR